MIKAIQTRYKGFHFRSRLEARWAVFFDTLGIEWVYEEEGFEKENVEGFFDDASGEWQSVCTGRERYLPDFRIGEKGSGLYVEVKGEKSQLISKSNELNELHDFDGILPRFQDSLGKCRGLLLLGDIPEPKQNIVVHPLMQHRKGVYRSYAAFHPACKWHVLEVIEDGFLSRMLGIEPEYEAKWDNTHIQIDLGKYYRNIYDAYRAARSARFEHGESGAT